MLFRGVPSMLFVLDFANFSSSKFKSLLISLMTPTKLRVLTPSSLLTSRVPSIFLRT
jgi:hypothetical protein